MIYFFQWHINLHELFNTKVILKKRTSMILFNSPPGKDKVVQYHSPEYKSESERNSASGVRPQLLRYRSSAR